MVEYVPRVQFADSHQMSHAKSLHSERPDAAAKVIHFVSGGFSGSTQVAIDLTRHAHATGAKNITLVLRRKRQTPQKRIDELRAEGLDVSVIPGWSRWISCFFLIRHLKKHRPTVFVSHGFPEHLIGRLAGCWAGIPHLVQVEHNSRERYTAFSRWLTRSLVDRTDAFVGCSEGVTQALIAQGLPAAKCLTISNGVHLGPPPMAESPRRADVLMVARFAKQKDHLTLVRGIARLRELYGLRPKLIFVGGGRTKHRLAVIECISELNLNDQIEVFEHRTDVREMMSSFQLLALSSHYEGLPLTLIEGMSAGCAVLGSRVPGIQELLTDGLNGTLVPPHNPDAWAHALAKHLQDPSWSAKLAKQGCMDARSRYSRESMVAGYETLLARLQASVD